MRLIRKPVYTRRPQDPAERKARQEAQGTARRFFAALKESIAVELAVQVAGMLAATVLEHLTRLISVSLGGRIERAKAAYEALRKATPSGSDGWIPAIVYGNVAEFKATSGEQAFALSLTDPMIDPAEYVMLDFGEDHNFSGVDIPIKGVDGNVSTIDGGIIGLQDAIWFRESVPPASIASQLRSWIDLAMAQIDPRERVKATIKQSSARRKRMVSAVQNLDTLRDNLATLNADPSYVAADAENGTA